MKLKRFALIGVAFLLALVTGCSDKIMGYSIVLWNIPEYKIQSGDVLPVYIKSNISHVYVAGTGGEDGEKIEVPLWKMTEPLSKRKVEKSYAKYAEHAHTYAHVKIDGLPCRAEPVNTSKQVYRFRKNEIIKILYKGEGQVPMSGSKPLEGDWYRILTNDGTEGWCFSYNLNLFELDENGDIVGGNNLIIEEEVDEHWENIINNTWYPDSFSNMIQRNNIDLEELNASYKFVINTTNNKVILNTKDIHESWDYTGYKKVDNNEYTLNDIPIKIIYKNAGYVVLRYTDSSGKPQDLDFVVISEDINTIVANEKTRRADEYNKIVEHGPEFKSSSYGTLSITEDGTFRWTGFKLLVPAVIPAGGKTVGTVSVKYSVSKTVQRNYDGVLTFKFEGIPEEVNFLYKLEDGGLRFEDTTTAEFNGNQLITRGSSPVIVYFNVKK